MQKNKSFFLSVIIGIFVLAISYSFVYNPFPTPLSVYDNPLTLKNKDYYNLIFDALDQKILNKAYIKYDKGEKLLYKYDIFIEKSDEFNRLMEQTNNPKHKKKYLKKTKKFELKATKFGLKSMVFFVDANQSVKNIYEKNLEKYSADTVNSDLIKILRTKAKHNFDTALIIRNSAQNLDNVKKYNKYIQADNLDVEALHLLEYMFFVYMKDHNEIKRLRNEYIPKKEIVVVEEVKVRKRLYDLNNDPNLYKSKLDTLIILTDLAITGKNIFDGINFKKETAIVVEAKADSLFSFSRHLAKDAKSKNLVERKELENKSKIYEKEAFYYKFMAISNYFKNNKAQFKIFETKYSKYRPADSTSAKYKKGIIYEKNAKLFYEQALIKYQKAELQTDNNKKLTDYFLSNDLLLTAIEFQENAYSVYFNLKETEITSIIVFEKPTVEVKDTTKIAKTDTSKTKNTKTNKTTKPRNNKFEYQSTWQYSIDKPTPVKITKKEGVLFRVQVATVKNPLSVSKFNRFMPITYDKFKNNELERYMAGEYRTNEAAELALMEIKSMGYNDASIIGYVNGTKTSYSVAKSKMTKSADYNELVKKEKAVILGTKYVAPSISIVDNNKTHQNENTQPKNNTTTTTKGVFVNSKDITKTRYLIYVVQLGTFLTPKTEKQLKNLSTIYETKTEKGMYRYMVGPYYSLSDAQNKNENVRELGFTDAYVTAFNEGQEIAISKATRIEQNVKASNKISFKIQIGAYASYLSDKVLQENFGTIKHNHSIETQIINSLVVYTVGNCATFEEVKKLQKEIINLGHSDCFIISFKGKNKISITEGIRHNKINN